MSNKQMVLMMSKRAAMRVGMAAFLLAAPMAWGQAAQYPVPAQFPTAPQLQLPPLPTPTAITANGQVVEDVIARVNDQIITRSEYERAEKGILESAAQTHASQADVDDQQKNLLRDMIDQQILLAKGKELGISGEADMMRQLDEYRKQNHLDSIDALQKAAEQQGVNFEDFKQNIRDHIISQQVIQSEVGRRINMTHAQEEAYYEAHKQDFQQPEQVHLSEILITTPDNATDAQIADAQKRADEAAAKIKAGSSFADVAKAMSGGPTASAGGDLGDFKRGTLGQVLEDATFSLPAGGVTVPIRTRQGFVILRVDSHQQAGVPPLKAIEPQVQEALYMQQMQPAIRDYLTKQRDQVYLDIAQGFVDTGSNKKEAHPTFTAYVPPAPKKKVAVHQRLEQEKAERAQEALAEARDKQREREAEKAAAQQRKGGVQNASMPVKPKKIHREKIRYGQAPRLSLPNGVATVTDANGGPIRGESAGSAMASNDAGTTITTGVGPENDEPLAQTATVDHKVRFSDRERQVEEQRAKSKVTKTTTKAQARPVQATVQETADEKQQRMAMGLNGDTSKKKHKRTKGEAKERLQEKPKENTAPAPVAPTVNPALTGAPAATATTQPASTTAPATQQ
jgi:peptidyl-prolyl cis-trans isomerase SurA